MITRNAIFAAKKLKGVIARAVGYDHIDVKATTEKREHVTFTLGANAVSVAESAFSLMIGAAWAILWLNSSLRAGVCVWEDESRCVKSEEDACMHH